GVGPSDDWCSLLGDRKVSTDKSQVIVTAKGNSALRDGISTNILASSAFQRAGEGVGEGQRAGRDLVGQRWVSLAVDLGLGIRGDLNRTNGDGKVSTDESQVIVTAKGNSA